MIWSRFNRKKNSYDLLVEKGETLAPFVKFWAAEITRTVIELQQTKKIHVSDEKIEETYIEFVYFYLHYIDRFVFGYLDVRSRDYFMDSLVSEVRELIAEELVLENFRDTYNKRQVEYGRYKNVFAKSDEGMAGTLFWEFAKKITRILDQETDISLIMLTIKALISSLKTMELDRLITGTNN
jgi:hypothetical protein